MPQNLGQPTIRAASSTRDWTAATALLDAYVEWMRAGAGLDPLVEQPGFEAELLDLRHRHERPDAALFIAWASGLTIAAPCAWQRSTAARTCGSKASAG